MERRLLNRQVTTLGTIPAPFRTSIEGPPIITEGLVARWDAGSPYSYGGSGATWTDITENGNTITLQNSPSFSQDKRGTLVFDGTNQYGTVTNSNIPTGTSDFTWLFWLRIPTTFASPGGGAANDGYAMILSSTQSYFYLAIFKTGTSYMVAYDNNSNLNRFGTVTIGTWAHVGVVRSSQNATGYVNAVAGTAMADTTSLTGSLEFARYGVTQAQRYYYNGPIAVGHIYNRALSASEIFQNYQADRWRFNI